MSVSYPAEHVPRYFAEARRDPHVPEGWTAFLVFDGEGKVRARLELALDAYEPGVDEEYVLGIVERVMSQRPPSAAPRRGLKIVGN